MSREANLTKKSGKPEVLLYRTFLKICISTAALSVFIRGFDTDKAGAMWFAVSVVAGIAYSFTYYLYKLNGDRDKRKHRMRFQCSMLIRFLFFMLGNGILFWGSELIVNRSPWAIPVCIIGLFVCQLLFNNKKIFSILSTFFENMVAGCLACAAYEALVIQKNFSPLFVALLIASFVCLILQALFFYLYMNGKNKAEIAKKKKVAQKRAEALRKAEEMKKEMSDLIRDDKDIFELAFEEKLKRQLEAEREGKVYIDSDEKETDVPIDSINTFKSKEHAFSLKSTVSSEAIGTERKLSDEEELRRMNRQVIKARLSELIRDALIVCSIIATCVLVVRSGLMEYVNAGTAYERASTIIPIVLSIITVVVLLYDNFIKKAKPPKISYLHKRDKDEFKQMIRERFGENCTAVEKAYSFITETMNKRNGYTRWYNGDDYFVHPQGVAEILMEHTRTSQEGIIVALLHDCKEDLRMESRQKFWKLLESSELGSAESRGRIKAAIDILSKNSNLDYGDPAIMTGYMNNILSSEIATLVKIADRMNNNSSYYGAQSEQKAMRFSETKRIYEPFVAQARANFNEEGLFFSKAQEFFAQDID